MFWTSGSGSEFIQQLLSFRWEWVDEIPSPPPHRRWAFIQRHRRSGKPTPAHIAFGCTVYDGIGAHTSGLALGSAKDRRRLFGFILLTDQSLEATGSADTLFSDSLPEATMDFTLRLLQVLNCGGRLAPS